MTSFVDYVKKNQNRFVIELEDFCRQPSVAAQNRGMAEMAQKVFARLGELGVEARMIPVEGGYPVVYGEIGSGPRTLMIYDHYDVQPAEPLELWETPPWEPTIRDGKMFARGVSDNKADLLLRIQTIESWLATKGELPLRVKFVIEGEEEIGSPNLGKFVAQNKGLLDGAHGCLWEFGGKNINEQPMLICGLKGIMYLELHAYGANRDLHSGQAAIVEDPAWRLVWACNSLKDITDHITIDNFYDNVRAPNDLEIEARERSHMTLTRN